MLFCRARDVFRQVTFPSNSMGLVTGIDAMAAAGLAFTFVAKGGVGLSVMAGHGFVIRKVSELRLRIAHRCYWCICWHIAAV